MNVKHNRTPLRVWAFLFWIIIWQIVSMYLRSDLLLVSPFRVIVRLCELIITVEFWTSIWFSLLRITLGFLLGTLTGILGAALAVRSKWIEELLLPLILTIKSVPVASFIILALVWFASENLAVLITFLIVFPVIYSNTFTGIKETNSELLEMGQVFQLSNYRKIRYIYIPQVFPFFYSSCTIALGMSWKSGIAAEVIGMPDGSIGEQLQQAKVFLNTPDLFAWTITIIIVSLAFEKLFLLLLRQLKLRLERVTSVSSVSANQQPLSKSQTSADLTIQQLNKSFDSLPVLTNFNSTLTPHEVNTVMAPSGAGKTTLLRILLGLIPADSGNLSVVPTLKHSVVFQEDRLCENLSAAANIQLVNPHLSETTIANAMQMIGLEDCKDKIVQELSGGMRRRVAILRALLTPSDILFFDEPFKGLDENTKQNVIQYIHEHLDNRTVFLIVHDMNEATALETSNYISL